MSEFTEYHTETALRLIQILPRLIESDSGKDITEYLFCLYKIGVDLKTKTQFGERRHAEVNVMCLMDAINRALGDVEDSLVEKEGGKE